EELSVILLGRRPYLKAKAGGESSLVGKAGYDEAREPWACRGPDGRVTPGLVEPPCPLGNRPTRAGEMTPWAPRQPNHSASASRWRSLHPDTLRASRAASNGHKGTNKAPNPS